MKPPEPLWRYPPAELALANDDVHVWRASLDRAAAQLRHLERTLAPDEWDKAARFYFEKDRERYVVTRGLLRAILGRYLGLEPAQLRFSYGPYGKPRLSGGSGAGALRFNLSHSHGLALFAVSRGREIGIDVERVRPEFAGERIAEQFFSPREVAARRALPPESRVEAFFNCWTRKEAYVKARGQGLSLPLDRFDVSLAPGDAATLLHVDGDARKAARWSLRALMPGPDYVAALAVEGRPRRLECWDWPLP